MKSRTRTQQQRQDLDDLFREEESLDLESLSEQELEELLFEEEEDTSRGFWNLPTLAGLSMILVGAVYILQEAGFTGFPDVSVLANMLPWLAGILIILIGFGVLSWRPNKKKKKVKKAIEVPSGKKKVVSEPKSKSRKKNRLTKSRDDRKIAGVCGGIAEYFNIDPTLVRIAFVIGTIASGGPFLIAYVLLAAIMPKPESLSLEERITIIRDS